MKKQFWISLLLLILLLGSCASSGVSRKDLAQEYLTIGNAYYEMGKRKEAAEYYRKALEFDKSLTKADYNLVRALFENDQIREGLSILEGLLDKDPDNLMLLETMGYARFKLEQYDKAEAVYREILEENPSNINAVYNLGLLAKQNEDYKESLDFFLIVNDKEPDDSVIYQLGHLNYLLEEKEKALEYFEEYIDKDRNNKEVLEIVLELYTEAEDYEAALNTLDLLVRVENEDSEKAEHYFAKAELLLTIVKDNKEGISAFGQALKSGFEDETRIKQLIEDSDVTARDELEKLVEEAKQAKEQDESGDDQQGSDSE